MNKQAIVAIEGNSFSGKTTTTESLAETFGVPIIHEYDKYAGGGLNFPSFPPDNYSEAKKSIDFFVELETRRTHDAIEHSIKSGLPVVMDRSPFSCLVFQWTVQKRLPEVPNAYAYSLETFEKAVQSGDIVLPDGLIYLEPESEAIFLDRVRRRGRVHIDFLNDVETLRSMRYWYKEVISKAFPFSGTIIQTVEGNIDLTTLFVFERLIQVPVQERDYILQDLLEI